MENFVNAEVSNSVHWYHLEKACDSCRAFKSLFQQKYIALARGKVCNVSFVWKKTVTKHSELYKTPEPNLLGNPFPVASSQFFTSQFAPERFWVKGFTIKATWRGHPPSCVLEAPCKHLSCYLVHMVLYLGVARLLRYGFFRFSNSVTGKGSSMGHRKSKAFKGNKTLVHSKKRNLSLLHVSFSHYHKRKAGQHHVANQRSGSGK